MYLDYKKLREFEDKIGYKSLIDKNKHIGQFLNFEPEVEWMVGTAESSCFNPKACGYVTVNEQKYQAEKWLKDNKEKYPNGWVSRDGYEVVKREYYPNFHSDWNHLIEAIRRLREKGRNSGIITENIFETWKLVYQNCK